MHSRFSKNIAQFVESELLQSSHAKASGNIASEFQHLENAHVLGQESTYWHVKVHVLMLLWAVRNSRPKEMTGQVFRIMGAVTMTAFGMIPQGNTGGANVSPFKVMPIQPHHQVIIDTAKDYR